MEYYNHFSDDYNYEIGKHLRCMKIKLEILDHWEFSIGEIINDLSANSVGTININLEQGCRRSCSFSIVDKKRKYLPTKNSPFWYNRKFKLSIGLVVGKDIYWFSQGIFVTKSATANNRTLSIEGIDKFGYWDGSLKTQMCLMETSTDIAHMSKGTKIIELIKDTLMLDMGNNLPTDPIEPIIDGTFKDVELYDDIVLSEGQYIGELFITLCNMYGANCYYDTEGHLRFERVFNDNIPSYYRHMSPDYYFNNPKITDNILNVQYDYDGYNIVTVSTDNTEGEIYSYTAKNTNPQSPVNIYDVGARGYDGGVVYISLGDTTDCENGKEKCRQYAEYLLLQNTIMNVHITFEYPLIPHLDVNHTICLSSDYYGYENEIFLIQSLTLPLGLGVISVEATNIKWLSSDTESISALQ